MTSVGITEIRSWERGPEFTFILGAAEKTLAGIRCVYVWCQQGPGRRVTAQNCVLGRLSAARLVFTPAPVMTLFTVSQHPPCL